jgi:hypothetical protein
MATKTKDVSALYTAQLAKRSNTMKKATKGRGRGRGKPKPRPSR